MDLLNIVAPQVKDREIAKDLVLDIMVRFYRQQKDIIVDSSLSSYFRKAARNSVLNYFRDKLRRGIPVPFDTLYADGKDSVTEWMDHKTTKEQILHGIDQLPDQCKKVFIMSREDGLTYQQIAEQLHISVHTVDQHIRKALRILRKQLGPQIVFWLIVEGLK